MKTNRLNLLLSALFVVALFTPGCESPVPTPPVETPAQRQALAKQAGQLSFLAFVAIEKPDASETAAIQAVLDDLKQTIKSYQQGGFISALPGVKEAMAKIFPNPEDAGKLLVATILAEDLLQGLDNLYQQHPGWESMNTEVTGIVTAYLDGATTGFSTFKLPCHTHKA